MTQRGYYDIISVSHMEIMKVINYMIKKKSKRISIMLCVLAGIFSLLLIGNKTGALAAAQVSEEDEKIAQERVMKQPDTKASSNEMSDLGTFDQPIRARVRADNVNVRAKPSVDAQIVSVLKKGTLIDLNQKSGNWFKVSIGHTYGYVSCEYVNVINGEETEPIYLALSLGTSGTEVLNLQRALIKSGYEIDKINGTYGAQTREAVKRFQQDNNLVADGIASNDVQLLLYGE